MARCSDSTGGISPTAIDDKLLSGRVRRFRRNVQYQFGDFLRRGYAPHRLAGFKCFAYLGCGCPFITPRFCVHGSRTNAIYPKTELYMIVCE